MAYDADGRVSVVVAVTSIGVAIDLGEAQVSARVALPAGAQQMTEGQLRIAALKAARRALEVAVDELHAAGA